MLKKKSMRIIDLEKSAHQSQVNAKRQQSIISSVEGDMHSPADRRPPKYMTPRPPLVIGLKVRAHRVAQEDRSHLIWIGILHRKSLLLP
jgi:hypothetical protein